MRAGPGADVIEPGSGRSGPALGAADRPVPRAAEPVPYTHLTLPPRPTPRSSAVASVL